MQFLFKLLVCVTAAYALAAVVAIPANPEIQFWHHVDQLRDREISAVRQAQPGKPIIFFTGGSSCAFSIDPKIIEETCGMPAFNLGLPVSAGPKYLLHQSLEKTRRGDILVIALEPDALTYDTDFPTTTFSYGMAISIGDPSAAVGGSTFEAKPHLRDYLNFCRPGPGYMATWLGKTVTRRGYRYQSEDIRYHGRIETSFADPSLQPAGLKPVNRICPTGHTFLVSFKNSADRKGVRLVYSMPWILTAGEVVENNRSANLRILSSIRSVMPAIDDGFQGVATDPAFFADSVLHLAAQGSSLRSKSLAAGLQVWLRNPESGEE